MLIVDIQLELWKLGYINIMKTRIFQLVDCDGNHAGLYITELKVYEASDELVGQMIEQAFETAQIEEVEGANWIEASLTVVERANEILESQGIHRVWATEVTTEVI